MDRVGVAPKFSDVARNERVVLSEDRTVAETERSWCSVALDGPPLREGRRSWAIRILSAEHGCGCAVGFAVADRSVFNFAEHNLGAQTGSFAYSKTGKVGRDSEGYRSFGDAFVTGDVLELDCDVSAGIIRFWRNGEVQGQTTRNIAFDDGVMGRALIPGVCLGSNTGGKLTRVQWTTPAVRAFDPARAHSRIHLGDDGRSAWNEGKWATVLAAHAGLRSGTLAFSVQLTDVESGGGVAVGVVDGERFDFRSSNLGASPHSWAFSKTGKVGDGTGFRNYAWSFTNGDLVTCIVDATAGTIRYLVNGADLGVAFDEPSLVGRLLVPAVCLGSSSGTTMCRVMLNPTHRPPLCFSPALTRREGGLRLSSENRIAFTEGVWSSALLDHEGIRTGYCTFSVRVLSAESNCGVAIGFSDAFRFNPLRDNLGAAVNSWAYSKTGSIGSGAGFTPFGPRFGSGDVVTADLNMEDGTLAYYLNSRKVGVAFRELKGRTLLPGVCLGSNSGGRLSRVEIVPPLPLRWSRRRSSRHVVLEGAEGQNAARTSQKWCTALAEHPGIMRGRMAFGVRVVECSAHAGLAVGLVDPRKFNAATQNLGAADKSWAVSRTGKRSAGTVWEPFTERLSIRADDLIGVVVDLDDGFIAFYYNERALGQAFSNLSGLGLSLVPAVCMGSTEGGETVSVRLEAWAPPA